MFYLGHCLPPNHDKRAQCYPMWQDTCSTPGPTPCVLPKPIQFGNGSVIESTQPNALSFVLTNYEGTANSFIAEFEHFQEGDDISITVGSKTYSGTMIAICAEKVVGGDLSVDVVFFEDVAAESGPFASISFTKRKCGKSYCGPVANNTGALFNSAICAGWNEVELVNSSGGNLSNPPPIIDIVLTASPGFVVDILPPEKYGLSAPNGTFLSTTSCTKACYKFTTTTTTKDVVEIEFNSFRGNAVDSSFLMRPTSLLTPNEVIDKFANFQEGNNVRIETAGFQMETGLRGIWAFLDQTGSLFVLIFTTGIQNINLANNKITFTKLDDGESTCPNSTNTIVFKSAIKVGNNEVEFECDGVCDQSSWGQAYYQITQKFNSNLLFIVDSNDNTTLTWEGTTASIQSVVASTQMCFEITFYS